jgi:hypothetical protein
MIIYSPSRVPFFLPFYFLHFNFFNVFFTSCFLNVNFYLLRGSRVWKEGGKMSQKGRTERQSHPLNTARMSKREDFAVPPYRWNRQHVGADGLQIPTESWLFARRSNAIYISHVTSDTMKISIFWDVSPDMTSSLSLPPASHWFLAWLTIRPWSWGQHIRPKRRLPPDYTASYRRR